MRTKRVLDRSIEFCEGISELLNEGVYERMGIFAINVLKLVCLRCSCVDVFENIYKKR